jgi:hypothetical protein
MNSTTFYDMLIPSYNDDNILVYNGESLPEDIKNNVTRSIENLMNSCRNLYDTKIYRSNHCIWYVLVKNIPDLYILHSLKNTLGMSTNNEILKNALTTYPTILFNSNIFYSGYPIINYLYNIAYSLGSSENLVTNDNFDLLG